MYSKNDYRYYLERQLMQSNDFLAHYGIKGMKWKKRKGGKDILDNVKRGYNILVPGVHSMNDIRNIRNGTRKEMLKKAANENEKGKERTAKNYWHITNQQRYAAKNGRGKRTVEKANMYSTKRKASYSKDKYNRSLASIDYGTGKTNYRMSYGQNQKKADMKADKKMRRQFINEHNPYSYDKKKSLSENVKNNKNVAKKRKKLKKKAYRQVDKEYRNV